MIDTNEIAGFVTSCSDKGYLSHLLNAVARRLEVLGVPVAVRVDNKTPSTRKEQAVIHSQHGVLPTLCPAPTQSP